MAETASVKSSNIISSAVNVLQALRFIADSRAPVNVTQISEHLDVSHPTAFRIARTLTHEGFLEFDSSARTYQISMDLVGLAWNVLERVEVRDIARPLIQEIVRTFGETITLAIPSDGSIVFVDRVEGSTNVRFFCDIGRRLPLHAGAAAKAILAHLPQRDFNEYVSQPLPKLTPKTITEVDGLRSQRQQIRERGYSISVDEVDVGVSAVGAPILNQSGDVIAAAAIANLTAKWDEDDVAARAVAMLELARKLNKKCAHLVPKRAA
jgi:DNA-binding IclR family transcriptional regulator